MSVRYPRCRKSSRAAVVLAVLVLATGVSGCAQIGETVPSAFADPATYELYDEFSTNNAKFKKVYDHWKGFRDEQYL